MKPRALTGWLALAAALSVASQALAGSPPQNSLTCLAKLKDGSTEKVIHLDLARNRACDGLACHDLVAAGPHTLKYDCVADKTFCAVGGSTAGPFVNEDHFTFNTITKAFRRHETGEEGDMISHPFDDKWSGTCKADSDAPR
jgi:hypothetical protein